MIISPEVEMDWVSWSPILALLACALLGVGMACWIRHNDRRDKPSVGPDGYIRFAVRPPRWRDPQWYKDMWTDRYGR